MHRRNGLVAMGLVAILSGACSVIVDNKLDNKGSAPSPDKGTLPPEDGGPSPDKGEPPPPGETWVRVDVKPEVAYPGDEVAVTITTSENFGLRPDKMGGANSPGEGHYLLRVYPEGSDQHVLEEAHGEDVLFFAIGEFAPGGALAGTFGVEVELVTNRGQPLDPPVWGEAQIVICGPEMAIKDPRCKEQHKACKPQDPKCVPCEGPAPCPGCVRRECASTGMPGEVCIAWKHLEPVHLASDKSTTIKFQLELKHTMPSAPPVEFAFESHTGFNTGLEPTDATAGGSGGLLFPSGMPAGPGLLFARYQSNDGMVFAEACWPIWVIQ